MSIGSELSELGYAAVLCMLKKDVKQKASDLLRYFTAEPESRLGSASLALAEVKGGAPEIERARAYPNLGVVYGTVDRAGLAALRSDASVRSIRAAPQLSLIRPVGAAAPRRSRKRTWGLEKMEIPALWDQGLTGKGVRVAHLDTGVDAGHPALVKSVVKFAEFDIAGREVPGTPPRDSDDRDGHGTHTAATIAGRPVRGHHVGVAPEAEVYSAMVIEGGDVVARVLGGMDWAIAQDVRILSMSLGIRGLINDFLQVIEVLRNSRILPVIAVGNEGPGTSRSPGNYPNALSVGAHDEEFDVAGFSSSQRFVRRSQPLVPDVVAPGVDVQSAKPGGGWRLLSGSSMATPHVAGLAALLLEAKPSATVAKVERAIFASARTLTMEGGRAGRGAVNGPKALEALLG